ncbi:hypothetical protein [Streptomyces cellulosae]|uniref:hypothetical protein n=1 Tax=Streptomyces cellulosae TaxID=1968 RepID=UPI0004C7F37D|nr:hypothetical protein [Streptomyces cellulosae]
MGHPDQVRHDPADAQEQSSGAGVHDRHWSGELRGPLRCSAALLVLLLVDLVAGDAPRRPVPAPGPCSARARLSSRGPLRERRP